MLAEQASCCWLVLYRKLTTKQLGLRRRLVRRDHAPTDTARHPIAPPFNFNEHACVCVCLCCVCYTYTDGVNILASPLSFFFQCSEEAEKGKGKVIEAMGVEFSCKRVLEVLFHIIMVYNKVEN